MSLTESLLALTAVEVKERNTSDTPQLPALLETTAKNFTVNELSADKAYASVENFNAIDKVGATPYIGFKSHHSGAAGGLFKKGVPLLLLSAGRVSCPLPQAEQRRVNGKHGQGEVR